MLNLHHSRSPHFPSVLHCLANFALVKLQYGSGSGSGSFILDFSLLSGSWPWESKFSTHVSKPLCKSLVENKQQKQLIDSAKPDDVHLTFQQFPFITILIYRRHFNQNFSWETVSFNKTSTRNVLWSKIDLIVRHISYFKFAARAIKPHSHATSVFFFFWKRTIA